METSQNKNKEQPTLKEFGIYFTKVRVNSGYESQRQLAIASGISNGTIARIESGIQKATPETLKKLAPLLMIDYIDLMKKAGYFPDIGEPAFRESLNGKGVQSTTITVDFKNQNYRNLIESLEGLSDEQIKLVIQIVNNFKKF